MSSIASRPESSNSSRFPPVAHRLAAVALPAIATVAVLVALTERRIAWLAGGVAWLVYGITLPLGFGPPNLSLDFAVGLVAQVAILSTAIGFLVMRGRAARAS